MSSVLEFLAKLLDWILHMLRDWPIGTIVAVLLIVTALLCLYLLAYGCFYLLDATFRETFEGVGVILEKKLTPKHRELSLMHAGKVMIPITRTVPARFELEIDTEDGAGWVSVTREYYKSVKRGKRIKVVYSLGRLSGAVYLKDIL